MTRLSHPVVRAFVAAVLIICLACFGVFAYFYVKYQKIVDERIRKPIFNNAAKIYAAPDVVRVGDHWTTGEIANSLRHAGYTESGEQGASKIGTYVLTAGLISVRPGAESFHTADNSSIHITEGKVDRITSDKEGDLKAYELEPQLVTGLFDSKSRAKRRLLTYDEIPQKVVDAIVSIEDRRFFEHNGINYVRLAEGVLVPLFRGHRVQGGSTLTMQMARGFFLNNKRDVRRKAAEIMIALELEQRFSKKQILELYVNQVDMGQRGSFDVRGFGEGAQAYFSKDIGSVSLPEAALLAGIVNGPSYFSPFRHPDRALERRNIVLQAMFENGKITQQELQQAKAAPLGLAMSNGDSDSAPFYIDLVRDQLLTKYSENDLNSSGMRVYTGIDPQLQQVAGDAIEIGMKQVDDTIRRQRTKKIKTGKGKTAKTETQIASGPMPQVALIALDPHTGQVLALAGGRNYGQSQLNHAVAKRPTGSIFKPFVYAAAINSGLAGDPSQAFTEATPLDATEQCFDSDQGPYCPRNFDPKYSVGDVSTRFALAHSINTATIKLAQMVGYEKVVQLARAAGVKSVRATPAMAIGAYDATPLDMAGAYTLFANGGTRISPQFITSVRAANGDVVEDAQTEKTSILDPRVAFIVTDMMQAVINNGTAAAVRAKFAAPAAGKTGTSHDAWFAGYTSNLLCIVWVGNDDYSDIKIEGAKAAAPIWTEFMVRAQKLQRYKDMKGFNAPVGVTQYKVDKATNLLATDSCPDDYLAYFLDGTQPTSTCDHPLGTDTRNVFQKLLGIGEQKPAQTPGGVSNGAQPGAPVPNGPAVNSPEEPQPNGADTQKKKKGFWGRVFGGGDKDKDKKPQPPQEPQEQ